MQMPTPRVGKSYTLPELAEIARAALDAAGLSQAQAAELLNERFKPQRGRFRQPQLSAAFREPTRNPGMVLMLLEAFTPYRVEPDARYVLARQ